MKSILLAIAVMISFAANKGPWGNGVVVVQYNAEFNKANSVKNLQRISDAKILNAWIDKDPELKETGAIRSVPSIILYNDNKEIRRWEAGIMMKLDITHHEVQKYVDELTGANKF